MYVRVGVSFVYQPQSSIYADCDKSKNLLPFCARCWLSMLHRNAHLLEGTGRQRYLLRRWQGNQSSNRRHRSGAMSCDNQISICIKSHCRYLRHRALGKARSRLNSVGSWIYTNIVEMPVTSLHFTSIQFNWQQLLAPIYLLLLLVLVLLPVATTH